MACSEMRGAVLRGSDLHHYRTSCSNVGGLQKRLGMAVVVNAVWLAFYLAKREGNLEAVSALTELIIDWAMGFVLLEGMCPRRWSRRTYYGV